MTTSGGSTSAPVPATRRGRRSFSSTYPGRIDIGGVVRTDLRQFLCECPLADDVLTIVWELSANACLYTRSGGPGGTFSVTVHDHPDDHIFGEVADMGSDWDADIDGAACWPHGLFLMRELAAKCGATGDSRSWRVWFTIAYPAASVPAPALTALPLRIPGPQRRSAESLYWWSMDPALLDRIRLAIGQV